MEVTIFTQIGFVVLVGLASKNAILIVEFAKQQREEGKPAREATLEASRLRLRPISRTWFAFIFGVVPLVVATGAGAEMRHSLGLAVFSGQAVGAGEDSGAARSPRRGERSPGIRRQALVRGRVPERCGGRCDLRASDYDANLRRCVPPTRATLLTDERHEKDQEPEHSPGALSPHKIQRVACERVTERILLDKHVVDPELLGADRLGAVGARGTPQDGWQVGSVAQCGRRVDQAGRCQRRAAEVAAMHTHHAAVGAAGRVAVPAIGRQ
jgi:hypothetical protein